LIIFILEFLNGAHEVWKSKLYVLSDK
jgi:hypothetical protein